MPAFQSGEIGVMETLSALMASTSPPFSAGAGTTLTFTFQVPSPESL
ncbi:hypothetical protein [Streptomyces diastatochromogenes]